MPVNKSRMTDAVEILHRRFYEGNPARLESLEEVRARLPAGARIRLEWRLGLALADNRSALQ